jgi:hypothetical protein
MPPKPHSVARLTFLRLTPSLHERLKATGLTTGRTVYQRTFRRILDSVRGNHGEPVAIIAERELTRLRDCANRDEVGGWQDWAREALEHNGL